MEALRAKVPKLRGGGRGGGLYFLACDVNDDPAVTIINIIIILIIAVLFTFIYFCYQHCVDVGAIFFERLPRPFWPPLFTSTIAPSGPMRHRGHQRALNAQSSGN